MPPAHTDAPASSPDALCWRQAMAGLAEAMAARGVHPAEAVVLLPYAQLIQQARQAWAAQAGETF